MPHVKGKADWPVCAPQGYRKGDNVNRVRNPPLDPRWPLSFVVLAAILIFAFSQASSRNIREITVTEAKALIDAGALVIDVREEDKYRYRHIPGAISLPLAHLRMGIPAFLFRAKDKPVVVYCSDGVTTGPKGTRILNKAGFTRAVNIKSGIDGWADAGLPIQK